jgi:regulator of protease activity HflC (stomatin/prohibitin superfamily)
MYIRISKDERGLLFRHNDYITCLKPGSYFRPNFLGYVSVIFNVKDPFVVTTKDINLYLKDTSLSEELEVVDVLDNEIVLRYEDDKFVGVLEAGRYAFWKVLKKHHFIKIDKVDPRVPSDIPKGILNHQSITGHIFHHEVQNYEVGLLTYNGVFQEVLQPGRYYFWLKSPVQAKVQLVDLRNQQLEINGQELMTEDKITLRINFSCQYKILDPKKVIFEVKNFESQIYTILQLAIREYIGNLKLDDILQKKQEIANAILEKIKISKTELGIEFSQAGLKDIILPGEIKDILNTVLLAEKRAQANIITRREEIASTRSLLNTAKLMEENPTLYRLKELESIEKISEKISSITISSGLSVLEQLSNTLTTKKG